MKVVQNGFGNNFGLVGKSVRRYLTTTAITTTALLALASPASADNWTDHTATEGSISIDTSVPSTTNITQHTDFTKVQGDGDINAGWTVNVAQPSSSSKYVLYDIEGDATQIMGTLNANGKIYIFDQNGVIFGQNSQVNVGSIVASTGTISDADIKADKLNFTNVGANGQAGNIELKGSMTVAESGLAAFVAPGVSNSGIINAKMGKVALASGEKVTLDLYGDDLVSITVDGNLENALVKNSGTIKAEGGHVALAAGAAKQAVDEVINMDGVIDVSSVSVKGGKIVLGGGSKGTVKVSGKLDASGKNGGGDIDVKGQNVHVADTSLFLADAFGNGNGGNVHVIAQDHADFRGSVFARGGSESGNGGFAEISGYGILGFSGYTDMSAAKGSLGTVLLDPTFAVIHSGLLHEPLGLGYVLSAQAIANSMKNSNYVVQADQFIDVGTKTGGYNTGNPIIDAALNLLPDGDIDLSTFAIPFVNFVPYPPFIIAGIDTGTTNGSIKFDTNVLNFNRTFKMGNGNVEVDANTVNVGAKLLDKSGTLLGDSRISSNANMVNVLSNAASIAASIQQGVWLANDAGGATVEVGNGTYDENVTINKTLKLKSKNGKAVTTINGVQSGPELGTIFVTGGTNNVQIGELGHGFTILGINGNGAVEKAGVYLQGNQNGTKVIDNEIVARGDSGLTAEYGAIVSNLLIDSNIFSGQTFEGANPSGVGSSTQFDVGNNVPRQLVVIGGGTNGGNTTNVTFTNNKLTGNTSGISTDDGVSEQGNHLATISSNGTNVVSNNEFTSPTLRAGTAALRLRGSNFTVDGNKVSGAGSIGIQVEGGNNMQLSNNTVSGKGVGILLQNASDITVGSTALQDPTLYANIITGGQTGILSYFSNNVRISGNNVTGASDAGINVVNGGGDFNIVYFNKVNGGKDGIRVSNTKAVVADNRVGLVSGLSGYGILLQNGSESDIYSNQVSNAALDGIKVSGGNLVEVSDNVVKNIGRVGIYAENATNLLINHNTVDQSTFAIGSPYGGITTDWGSNITISKNKVSNSRHGIWINDANGTNKIDGNFIDSVTHNGIQLTSTDNTEISGNKIGYGADKLFGTADDTTIGGKGIYATGGTNFDILANFITKTGAEGIYVDNVDNADNLDINDNTIDNTKGDGIEVQSNGASIRIKTNKIGQGAGSTITGNGILLLGATGGTIQGNKISNTISANKDDASGIYLNKTKNVLAGGSNAGEGNIIHNVEWDGIKIAAGDNVRAEGNTISKVVREGVFVDSGKNINVIKNTISNILNTNFAGVTAQRVQGVHIEGNTISDADFGVRLRDNVAGTGNTVSGNTISDIWTDGVNVSDSSNVKISKNKITDTGNDGVEINTATGTIEVSENKIGDNVTLIGGNGVFIKDTTGALVKSNTINGTGSNGIFVDPSPSTIVEYNVINNTGAHGVYILDSDNSRVRYNQIGLLGADHNINGDGVLVKNSHGTWVKFNDITNTTSTAHNIGSGVQSLSSNNVVIEGNDIWDTDWDGVRVEKGDNVLVKNNDIYDAVRTGIYLAGLTNSTAINNDINTVNHYGIHVNNGSVITLDNNEIDRAKIDGIYVIKAKTLLVQNNDIGETGGSNNIGRHGIYVSTSNGAIIRNNDVTQTVGHGILVNPSDNVDITGNDIWNVDGDGIHVDQGNNVEIWNNDIDNTGGDGIDVYQNANARIWNNYVDDAGENGIKVFGSNNAYVATNLVTDSSWDGIELTDSDNADIRQNLVYRSGDDGIDVLNSDNVDIVGNTVLGTAYNGIEVSGSDYAYIFDNNVTGAGLDGINVDGGIFADIVENNVFGTNGLLFVSGVNGANRDGIHVTNHFGADILRNNITGGNGGFLANGGNGAGRDGIYVANSAFADIIDNNVTAGTGSIFGSGGQGAGDDGIDVRNSFGVDVSDNTVDGVDGDGVQVRGSWFADVLRNIVRNAGDDGIDVEGSAFADINGNRVRDVANNGIEVENSFDADIRRNRVNGTGADGIFVDNSDYADIRNNRVRNTGDDGIDVRSSDGVDIVNNRLRDTGRDGIQVRFSNDLDVRNNRVRYAGDAGINVENGDDIEITGNNVRYSNSNGIEVTDSTNVLIDDNRSRDNGDAGIYIDPSSLITVSNNYIDGNKYGIHLDAVDQVLILGNDIRNNDIGLYAAGGANGAIEVTDNDFTDNLTHAQFESGIIDLTNTGNRFVGGEVALYFSPFGGDTSLLSLVDDDAAGFQTFPATARPTNFGGTIGAQFFDGQSEAFVKLDNNAFRTAGGDAIWLNGLNSTYVTPFGNITPNLTAGGLDQPTFDFLEGKFQHYPDMAGLTGIFFFGFVPSDIDQSDIFNTFGAFNGDLTGLNVRITGLPNLPGQIGNPAARFNNIQTFAGNNTAANLNNIETAAGGDTTSTAGAGNTAQELNQIESASGGEDTRCWGDAMTIASGGQAVNVVYQGSFSDNLDQASACAGGI